MTAPYPWLEQAWQRLQDVRVKDQLPHALLLRGREGFGKSRFAQAFIRTLLCRQPGADGEVCGQCRGCGLFTAGNHPDYLAVAPEEAGKAILVEAIRELGHYFSLRSHYSGTKVALIEPADAMNRAAANALLKLLEEPPQGACLILVANRPERLPATIRSRCQHFVLDRVPAAQLLGQSSGGGILAGDLEALARAGGSPLRMLELAEPAVAGIIDDLPDSLAAVAAGELGPVVAAAQYAKLGLLLLIDQVLRICYEVLLLKHDAPLPLLEIGRRIDPGIQRIADRLDSRKLAAFIEKLMEVKQLKLSSVSLRDNDLGESLWFDWRMAAGATDMATPKRR